MANKTFNKDEIIAKVNNNRDLTRDEERFYLREVLNYPADLIERIFAINDNQAANVTID